MYYPQQQQQPQQNYVQNYSAPIPNNKAQINPSQYQYPGYALQPNQIKPQTQYQQVHHGQNIQNVQQVQNIPNYQNVPQIQPQNQAQKQQPKQNIQYVQVPGQHNTYIQYTQPQPAQQVYMQQGQQVHAQNPKHNQHNQHNQYSAKTTVPEGNYQIKPQEQNLVQNIQVTNTINQPQNQKMVFKGGKPITTSHNQKTELPHSGNKQHLGMDITNTQMNNANLINNTVFPVMEQEKKNNVQPKIQRQNNVTNNDAKKSATMMSINTLAGLKYNNYPVVEFSTKPYMNISGYGCNTYNGKIKIKNEDTIKHIYNVEKTYVINDKTYKTHISYFGIFDGHGGDNCSIYLKNQLDKILFNLPMFPYNIIESVREMFRNAEDTFKQSAIQGSTLVDKSGSCALISLIINNILYAINLGDSRALYSKDGGKEYYQLTRDHKPNDSKEKARIEAAGGQVYYANKAIINGVEVTLKEEQFGQGFKFPFRLKPSGLAVS